MDKKQIARQRFYRMLNYHNKREGSYLLNNYTESLNRFFKNKTNDFVYNCRCNWCKNNKTIGNQKNKEASKEEINDYWN